MDRFEDGQDQAGRTYGWLFIAKHSPLMKTGKEVGTCVLRPQGTRFCHFPLNLEKDSELKRRAGQCLRSSLQSSE